MGRAAAGRAAAGMNELGEGGGGGDTEGTSEHDSSDLLTELELNGPLSCSLHCKESCR